MNRTGHEAPLKGKPLGFEPVHFLAGLLVTAVGVYVLVNGFGYGIGTARRMGAGYFPSVLGALLVLIGIGIVVFDARRADPVAIGDSPVRSILAILAAIATFAVLIRPLGLALAAFAAAFISSFASEKVTALGAAVTAILVALGAVLIFSYGIGLQMKVFPL